MFLPNWSYDGADPGLRLFTLANAKLPHVHSGVFIYEIGAADTDWVERAEKCLPLASIGGVDWRDTGRQNIKRGDVMTMPLPNPNVFVGISSIEHIGLGHYEKDPVDPDGDTKAVLRLKSHLQTDGWIYFDVPYAPEGYHQIGTKCRVYDDQALRERFGPHEVLGYTNPSVDGWIDKPTTNHQGQRPYYYVALLIRKDA